jgi:hypothetical protein
LNVLEVSVFANVIVFYLRDGILLTNPAFFSVKTPPAPSSIKM